MASADLVDAQLAKARKRIGFERGKPLRLVLSVPAVALPFRVISLGGDAEGGDLPSLPLGFKWVHSAPQQLAKLAGFFSRLVQRDILEGAQPVVAPPAVRLQPSDPALRPSRPDFKHEPIAVTVTPWFFHITDLEWIELAHSD